MKLWNRVCSLLLAAALLFGLLPTVRPTVVEAAVTDTPAGVRNHLPSTAKDIVYLSDMAWEYSYNNNSGQAIRDGAWTSGNIILGATSEANGGTKFTKGLGVMPNTGTTDSNTIFDLSDNNYEQSFFYSAVGITNTNGITYAYGDALSNGTTFGGEGVIFEVWASYDRSGTSYGDVTDWVKLESSGKITKGLVYQFHLDVTGVRYLKLVTANVGAIASMNSAWGGACLYNNPGYYPKSDLLHDTNGSNQSWVAPENATRFQTYQYINEMPAGAVSLSGTDCKGTDYKPVYTTNSGRVVEFASASSQIGNSAQWIGGASIASDGTIDTTHTDGLQLGENITLFDLTSFLRFNARTASNSSNATDGWITFDISDLDVNRFYTVVGFSNANAKQNAYSPSDGAYGGMKVQVWGAAEENGEFTLLSESEPIMLSQTGEFDVDITGVNFLKLRIQAKDYRNISAADMMFFRPCVYSEVNVTVDGDHSVLRGLTGNYTDTVTGGDGSETVTWAVTGAASESTTIDASTGVLTVDSNETATYLEVTASVTVDEVTTTSESFPVVVRRTPQNMYNQLPETATDIQYLSDMAYKVSSNRDSMATKTDAAVDGLSGIVLGDLATYGGTRFIKGLTVKPYADGASAATLAHTVYDLKDNAYAQSYFYAAAGIINNAAKQSGSTVSNGVYFAVYGSYDKTVESYENAEFVLLETSDKITNGAVYQFHVDVTGVRYLKLVVYTAQSSVSYMDCAWGGACVYNNAGYYPKTDMIGDCSADDGVYVAYADRDKTFIANRPTMFNYVENMFNTYQFENLPSDAVKFTSQTQTGLNAPGLGKTGVVWLGGTHVAVAGQGYASQKDGVKFPANSSIYFKNQPVSNGVAEGYVVYDVSSLNADTFYAIVGRTDHDQKYQDYDRTAGTYGGLVFEVYGTYEGSSEFKLLSASEVITKSNTGEFIVDITGVQQLKLRIRQQDPRSAQSNVGFAYASVFKALDVSISGATSVEPGTSESYTATARHNFTDYSESVTWKVTGAENDGTVMDENGVLTVDPLETAASLTVTASVTVDGETVTDQLTVNVEGKATGVYNHRPKTAEDIVYLSDMSYVHSENYEDANFVERGYHFVKDGAWRTGSIILGVTSSSSTAFDNTTFEKGLGMMPKGTSTTDVSNTVFDLKDNNYEQSFFYSAAGLTNASALGDNSAYGVVFAVYGSYDKTVESYEDAEFVLLEKSDTLQMGAVHQFHVDVTGVRYLKLVVYAVGKINGMNAAWGGACLYNNDGYYPKTDMIGDCDQTSGAYLAYEERVPSKTPTMFNYVENMFNTYQFENLPASAILLRSEDVSSYLYPGLGKDAIWLGGAHVAVNGQGWQSAYDGIQLPAGSTPYFKDYQDETQDPNEGYVVYDVSELDANTFYAIIGATDRAFKYSDYDPDTGNYGGIVFEVWGDYGDDKGYQLLSASEVITKSNTGEFIVDITGVQSLKLLHRQQDENAAQVHGAFGYASVFSQLSVTVSGGTAVEKGATEHFTAVADNGFADCDADITWKVSGTDNAGTTIDDNGVLTVAADEAAKELTVTASVTVGEKIITDSVIVTVVEPATGVLNHRPATATDVQHLSNMTWEYSINNGDKEAVKDKAWSSGTAIVLGDLAENGGTTFSKGIGVQPDKSADPNQETAMQTVFDLADNGYKQSFFYAAAGITNNAAKQSGSTVTNGVYFAVWASYDKDEEDYTQAEYVLLETSDKITGGAVHQFHLDITGVRYLKLVVYTAQNSYGYMDCNWAGACVYNNAGYYPKTDMIGDCSADGGKYVAPADPTMFNTYHFDNLPDSATTLATLTADPTVALDFGNTKEVWVGGTHLAVNGLEYDSQKDGIKVPANTSVYFNVPMNDEQTAATDGYAVYDVSGLDATTFYCIVGATNMTYKYTDYDRDTGACGGMVFEVWGDYGDGYQLLSASEPILKSNTGEFFVDITGVNYLKLQIRAQDTRINSFATGAFAYASVLNEEWTVAASGKDTVVKGGTAEISAQVTRTMIPGDYYTYTGDIAWAVDGGAEGTKVNDGILTVASDEMAESLKVTASITEGGSTLTSDPVTLAVAEKVAYVGDAGYDTLAEAIADANGQMVVLQGDASLTKAINLNSQVNLDLNGNTVTGGEYITLSAAAQLTISGGGSLNGKMKLIASGAQITSDCAVTLEMNGFNATVNGCPVTLTDSGTNDGTVGGKIYGDCTVKERLTRNGVIRYVVLDGSDSNGAYKTANAVRVKLTKVSIRPSEAGMYYTTELKFNQNVADAGANYGVVLSTQNKPGTDFMTELKGESNVNLWTKGTPAQGADFQKTGNSCLVQNILSSSVSDSANATRGATEIYANGYVKLTVDGQEIVVMAENSSTVKYSLQAIMVSLDESMKTELQTFAESKEETALSTTGKNLYNFYETWEGGMRSWKLSNLIAAYERDIAKSHMVVASDILNGRIVVTDLDKTNALTDPTWTWTPTKELGWSVTVDQLETNLLAEVKYRQHPEWGDVVFFCGAGTVGAIEYPSGKCLWELSGFDSPHGIEMLPGGDIVVSCSGGSTTTNGMLYYYNWNGSTYASAGSYTLQGSHSVTWDGSYLWVMGELGLMKYTVDTTNNKLTKVGQVWLTDNYGHDVSPDYSDSNILWLTDNIGTYRYNKTTGVATISEYPASMGGVKSIATFPDKEVAWASYSDCGEAVNPPTIRVFRPRRNGTYVTVKLTDETSGWNKVRPFIAAYQ